MFQRYIPGEVNPNKIIFHVPIGSAKTLNLIGFYPYAPAIKYVQHDENVVYSLAWNVICLIPENMFQNRLLTYDLSHILKLYHLVIWIG